MWCIHAILGRKVTQSHPLPAHAHACDKRSDMTWVPRRQDRHDTTRGHSRREQQLLGLELLRTLRLVYADALRPKLLAAYVAHNSLGPAAGALHVAPNTRTAAGTLCRRRASLLSNDAPGQRTGHDAIPDGLHGARVPVSACNVSSEENTISLQIEVHAWAHTN